MKTKLFAAACLLIASTFAVQPSFAQCSDSDPSSPVGITPTLVLGNPDLCAGGIRIDPPASGTYALDAFGNTVTVTLSSGPCGQVMTWSVSSGIVIDHVIAKGGPNANDYDYTGEDPRPSTDGNLHCPVTSSGMYAAFSHIDFCFHYRLDVSKTAEAEFTRTYDWTVDKTCDGPNPLILAEGQAFNYPFSWTASATSTDSDFQVSGTISIENNTPYAATITSIDDVLTGGIVATADCGVAFPYVLASGATLNCTYSADLPGASNGTNTVTVVTSTPLVEGGSATADYVFGDPTSEVDECATVTDDCTSPTTVCASSAPVTHTYTCPVGPYDVCGPHTYTNTASFTTNDQGVTGGDNCVVDVDVRCNGEGCTLTPGYWKTHSEFGPAPYDDNWAQLPNGASTVFFLSGKTYYEVLWTPPLGNAYYILAHAYIAAELNLLNGASSTPEVDAAIAWATNIFSTKNPNQITGPLRAQALSYATLLDNYNNGLIGPGHCSEEGSAGAPQGAPVAPNAAPALEPSTWGQIKNRF